MPVVKNSVGRPKKEEKTVISTKISQELQDAIRKYIDDTDTSKTFLTEKILQDFLKNPPKEVTAKFSKENKVVFSTKITPDLQEKIRDYTDKNGRNISFLIEYVFRKFLGLDLASK